MPIPHQTIFVSSGDNAACAAEFSEALGEQGIKSKIVDEGAQVSVFYETDDLQPLIPIMMAIEEAHPAVPKSAPEPSGNEPAETPPPT